MTILDAAREAGVYIESSCGGRGTCGKCRVQIESGRAGPLAAEELDHLLQSEREAGYRLACRAQPESDMVALVPAESLVLGSAARKGFKGQLGAAHAAVLTRRVNGRMSVVRHDGEIIDVRSAEGPLLGAALDVGTTTLALYLCDLSTGELLASASVSNPQIVFGADIMSRIAYSTSHPGDGVRRMQGRLVQSVNGMIEHLTAGLNLAPSDIVDMSAVGNTVMHHILLGIAPDGLGLFPFAPLKVSSSDVPARDLGLIIHPKAFVHVLPVEAGFVGADNVAVLISEEPYRHRIVSLTIDIGTNGELVIGNRDRLLCCSCATGPALEGAQISAGMRALPGAIDTIRIEPGDGEIRYTVIGSGKGRAPRVKPDGICGSGIIDAVAELLHAGIIGSDGAFKRGLVSNRLRPCPGGGKEFVIVRGRDTAHGGDIVITQRDIRQIQLAKAALSTGAELLMREFGVESVERLVIAGAFGTHLNIDNALAIGLLPDMPRDRIAVVGNAAGRGACLALVNVEKRAEADRVARWVEHVELARLPDFQKAFIAATRFGRTTETDQ
jgi:uncharacterized 2Fe-2S/4Fe-4S cluster protein (DUF4445 family)